MKPERHITWWLATLVALGIAGCETQHYEITMTPNGQTVQRELTFWRERTANQKSEVVAFPDDELASIAAAYEVSIPAEKASKHKFIKAFSGALPNDLGGSGSYTHWNTSLGSVSAYVERVRGNDDLLADVETRQQAANRLADLLTGWLAAELEGEAGFAELHEFLDQQLRRDLNNLSLYSWGFGVNSDHEEAARTEWLVRVGQYLVERSYFTPDQLPMLARAVREAGQGRPASLLTIVQRFAAAKMGVAADQPIPAGLAFLADTGVLELSVNDALRQTEEFQQLLEVWNRERGDNPDAEAPEPNAVIGELAARAFLPAIPFGRSHQLSVKVALTAAPFSTNGQWDAETRQVHWSRDILAGDEQRAGFPTILYAVWSSPDGPAQREHFGRIVLEGEQLSNYALWYCGLSLQEAKEWDGFISKLRPSDDLTERLRAFRFSDEPPVREGQEETGDLAATPRELILLGLEKSPCRDAQSP